MKTVQLMHNPGAGDEEHSKEELCKMIRENGFDCRYTSTDGNKWKKIKEGVDLLAVAGGDGTIHVVAKEILEHVPPEQRLPIAVLPFGTANNVAQTLDLRRSSEVIVQSWHEDKRKKFDAGRVIGLNTTPDDMLEGMGYGVFPKLMRVMKETQAKKKKEAKTPDEEIKMALTKLHDIIMSYKPKHCTIVADNVDYSGTYLMVELMNIRSIGSNLLIAPDADPGDGVFELVLIGETDRNNLASYVMNKIRGIEAPFDFPAMKVKNVAMQWQGAYMHIDDDLIKVKKGTQIKVTMQQSVLEFLV